MSPRPIARGDLHVRLPLAGHEALVTYAEREGISLNTALWLLVRRGLEHEGIRFEVGGRRPAAPAPSVDREAEAVASTVERAVDEVAARGRPLASSEPSSSTLPPRAAPRRRRGRRR